MEASVLPVPRAFKAPDVLLPSTAWDPSDNRVTD